MSTKTITFWQKDQYFKSYHGDHEIRIDGKREHGFGAKALLLSATAACSEIDTEADQTEEHPRVFKDIYITYKIKTAKANEDKVKKAIELSLEKYCGVSAMMKKNSPIHFKLHIL